MSEADGEEKDLEGKRGCIYSRAERQEKKLGWAFQDSKTLSTSLFPQVAPFTPESCCLPISPSPQISEIQEIQRYREIHESGGDGGETGEAGEGGGNSGLTPFAGPVGLGYDFPLFQALLLAWTV